MFQRTLINMQTKDFSHIKGFPTVVDNNHESIYRSYQILERVKVMLNRGDSRETIVEMISFLEQKRE